MGARVVGGGAVVPGGWLAMVVGSCAGGCRGSTPGVAADGCAVVGTAIDVAVGTAVGTAVGIAFDTLVDAGVASVGVNVCCAGWAGCSSATGVAAAGAIVARGTAGGTPLFYPW